jgi:diguanylate cyclase (GGDEF)-like protein
MIEMKFDPQPPLILVVDDQKVLRLLLRQAMETNGYRVQEATDGRQCIELCRQLRPDIILLDAMMPEMDGFECCAQLSAVMGEQCPPVLMITVLNDETSVDRAFAAGASDFVTKPIHWAVLRQRVKRLLASVWAMKQLQQQFERERQLTEQLAQANRELHRLASLDGLTQIANRRCFDEYLQQQWQCLTQAQAPLSLILCDIDFYKAYNDTYGHLAGDECLKQIAKTIEKTLSRPEDFVARYGGEEFGVILPNTPATEAIKIAEQIRQQVKNSAALHASSPISNFVTLSLGVASTVPNAHSSAEQLVNHADIALYQAKLEGRDRVKLHLESLVRTEIVEVAGLA